MKYNTIIFDLDGTLLNTLEDLADAVNYALKESGYPLRTTDEVRRFIGNGVKKLMERSTPDNITDGDFEKCYQLFREYYKNNSRNKTAPFEGITDLLKKLKEQGIKTAVVTNKMDEAAQDVIRYYFGELIDITIGQRDGIPTKPDPACVNKAIESLNAEKESCIFIGDSDVDILAGHNAGLPAIGVTWGYRSKELLLESGADYIAESPFEILEFIK